LEEILEGIQSALLIQGGWMISPMSRLAIVMILIVGFQHLAFFILESFLWERPIGLQIFRNSPEKARATAQLAVNQGVYNAFLGVGLLWGLWILAREGMGYIEFSRSIEMFFLSCVVIAGIVGGITVHKRILLVQAMPAAFALLLLALT
jgi:putative membrane protein